MLTQQKQEGSMDIWSTLRKALNQGSRRPIILSCMRGHIQNADVIHKIDPLYTKSKWIRDNSSHFLEWDQLPIHLFEIEIDASQMSISSMVERGDGVCVCEERG